ncbi:hypothetical protein BH09MYX1_BH09MYX1_09360 [soil metagenome]
MASAKGARPVPIASKAVGGLPVSPTVAAILSRIQEEVSASYRDRFIEMLEIMRQQASQLERIQHTLAILVKTIEPKLDGQVPTVLRIAAEGERADLATAVVVADPIGAGYTMSQADVATALGLSGSRVSVLIRAFKLDVSDCAVTVRRGTRRTIVNYHPRVLDAFRRLVMKPPEGLRKDVQSAIAKTRAQLLGSKPADKS